MKKIILTTLLIGTLLLVGCGRGEELIGGETDEHGCLGPAGYTWCEAKEKCLRMWEEVCDSSAPINTLSELIIRLKAYNNENGVMLVSSETEFNWMLKEGDPLKIKGESLSADEISGEAHEKLVAFFKNNGFEINLYNIADGTISGREGYKKGLMVCIVTSGITGYKEAENQWIPTETNMDVEIECGLLEKDINETDNWQTYENEKFQYSFKYPSNCLYGPLPGYCKQSPPEERPQECRCYLNGEDLNSVSLGTFTGPKDNLNGASFIVFHSIYVDYYSPPAGTDLVSWVKENFPHQDVPDESNMELDGITAVKVYTPFSGMAYSQEDIYFIKNDKLFSISILDVDNSDNRELYDQIISTFKFTN